LQVSNLVQNAKCDLVQLCKSFLQNLSPGPLAVAVSGGSDSLGLLLALIVANEGVRPFICLTVDHGLRVAGKDEAVFVADLCARHHVVHETLVWCGDKPNSGLQDAARQERYRLMLHACHRHGAVGLVTGHTFNDQVETLIMRSKRDRDQQGLGMSGMAPMTLISDQATPNAVWLMRPLLKVQRKVIQDFLIANHQSWVTDPSNEDMAYERVRTRLSKLSSDEDFDQDYMDDRGLHRREVSNCVGEYLQQNLRVLNDGVALVELVECELPILARAIEAVISTVGGRGRSLGGEQRSQLQAFLQQDVAKRVSMGRTLIHRKKTTISIRREDRDIPVETIEPNAFSLWDGRFIVKNLDICRTLIVAGDKESAGLLPKLKWQIDGTITGDAILAKTDKYIQITRYINKYDGFLSSFDLAVANVVALKFKNQGYLSPPIDEKHFIDMIL
jgi:tRNA(Ile)-lysidine synthase